MESLPEVLTAAALAEFLEHNRHDELSFQRRWYPSMGSWTDGGVRAASDAARRNASVRSLAVDVAGLGGAAAGVIARIVCELRHVRKVWVRDSMRFRGVVGGAAGAGAAAVPGLEAGPPSSAAAVVVDTVLRGVMASQSNVVDLQLFGCCSPHTFREFIARFPHLGRLDVDGQRGPSPDVSETNGGDPTAAAATAFDEFALAVSLALRAGQLPVLKQFGISSDAGDAPFLRLLHAAHMAPTVDLVYLNVANRSRRLLTDAALFCTSNLVPRSLESVAIRPNTVREFLDVSPLFPPGLGRPFAPSINDVQFSHCVASAAVASGDLGGWLDRAAVALRNVEQISFTKCNLPPGAAMGLIGRLPRLRLFSCLSRAFAIGTNETLDDEFDDAPYELGTNRALDEYCRLIERPDCALTTVELDIVSERQNASVDFPAIESLLKHSRGRLVVNFGQLPAASSVHLIHGAEGLSVHLRELRVRFCRCHFGDANFASFIRALGAARSLKVLEFGFDQHAGLGTPEASIAAIRDLLEFNTSLAGLTLRGVGSDAVCAVVERTMPVLMDSNRSLRTLSFLGTLDRADAMWPLIRDPLRAALQRNGVFCLLGGDLRVPTDDREIRHLFRQNHFGRHVLLPREHASPLPVGLWATILARIAKGGKHHDVMHSFLRHKLVSLLRPCLDRAGGGGDIGAENPSGGRGCRKRSRAEAFQYELC
jgi:hypothetical protein